MDKFKAQLNESYNLLTDKLSGWLDAIILQFPNFIIALIVAIIAYFFSKYIRKAAVKAVKKFTSNRTILNLTSSLAALVFGTLILFLILSIFNLSGTINKILATAGVLGLAVGLALQDPMTNLFSGVSLSVRDLYNIGDLVETNGYFGTIVMIDLRSTRLRLPTGQVVVIPNKEVIQKPLSNYTRSGERRIDLSCGISYGEKLENVEKVAVEAIKELPSLCEGKDVDLVYTSFGDSSINFIIRYWITASGQKDFLVERSNGIKALKKAFDANNIVIPFPIRTLDFGIKGGTALKSMLNGQSSISVESKS